MSSQSVGQSGLNRLATVLSQRSIIYLVLGWVRVGEWDLLDDKVTLLQSSPLGMFFYNERAIFFGLWGLLSAYLLIYVRILGGTEEMARTAWVVGVGWLCGTAATVLLHRSLRGDLEYWASSLTPGDLPLLFDRYFLLDIFLLLALIGVARSLKLDVGEFAVLLLADTVIYGAFVGTGRRSRRVMPFIVLLAPAITFFLLFGTRIEIRRPVWFFGILYLGPLATTWTLTVISVLMISWLRATDHMVTVRYLHLLGEYERALSGPEANGGTPTEVSSPRLNNWQHHQKQVRDVLESLCSLGPPFWYRSACVWDMQAHKDRGEVLIPGPSFEFDDAAAVSEGIDKNVWETLWTRGLAVLPSLKYRPQEWKSLRHQFRPGEDSPAAFIPLRVRGKQRGVLALYGREGGPAPQRQEGAFLSSLASIISNTIEQWENRYRAFPLRAMDDLFMLNNIGEVFTRAAAILKEFLAASGSMVIFRHDPAKSEMRIVAKEGFSDLVLRNEYDVGRGQTGKCAQLGQSIRFDDLSRHAAEFDAGFLRNLVRSHGARIKSWMAIPIGTRERNYGVIKVVNAGGRCSWFTDYEQSIGEDLALRLKVIIEKFLYIGAMETATREARRHSEAARSAQLEAERTAEKRREDLMIITHQLQGPLASVIGSLSVLRHRISLREDYGRSSAAEEFRELDRGLSRAQDLVEDCITLAWGTLTAFALDANRSTSLRSESINVPKELRKLCNRLKLTNARPDIRFLYQEDPGFPVLRMDPNIFASVFHSLVHNAMKYSDEGMRVILACSFEHGVAAVKVKSTGEPIEPDEKEHIFEMFRRGRAMERGRHHSGVGLGLWVARKLMREIGGDLTLELSPHNPRFSVFIVHVQQRAPLVKGGPHNA
jgi:signal transduction histidine kinase